ncbi:uncharacterized protein TNCV_5056951 [Trichonephila clavipes]|nr:uncharacterized protein TNCV_5056951 [Trichonephila clavipes]
MSSNPVPLKTRRVGQRCTLNLSRAERSSRGCGVVVRRGGCQLRCRPRHLPWFKITWSVAKSPRVAEQCDVNKHSLTMGNYYLNSQCGHYFLHMMSILVNPSYGIRLRSEP